MAKKPHHNIVTILQLKFKKKKKKTSLRPSPEDQSKYQGGKHSCSWETMRNTASPVSARQEQATEGQLRPASLLFLQRRDVRAEKEKRPCSQDAASGGSLSSTVGGYAREATAQTCGSLALRTCADSGHPRGWGQWAQRACHPLRSPKLS